MESKLAKQAEKALVEATQRLRPEERLNAFLEHCRLGHPVVRSRSNGSIPHAQPQAMRASRSGESALMLLDVVDLLGRAES